MLDMKNSSVTAEASEASGGNIEIKSDYMIYLDNSQVTASVGGGPDTVGGNIFIDPEFVILKDSEITANADEGQGGNIDIYTDVFLKDPDSIVDASSREGINGKVNISAAFEYLSENPATLSEDFKSAVELLREPCLARMQGGNYSSLVVSGRGALPVEPGGLLPSPAYVR
jgi:large exoprotein involved in heme utilization and adhesion